MDCQTQILSDIENILAVDFRLRKIVTNRRVSCINACVIFCVVVASYIDLVTSCSISCLMLNRTTFITCPRDPLLTLGIRLPVIVLQLKNIGKYISFDLQVAMHCHY